MSFCPWNKLAVINPESDAMSSGTKLAAVKSIMITSTAKIIAATGALNSAAKEAEAAQPIKSILRLNARFVCRPISDPMAAADCSEGDAIGFNGIVLSPGPGLPSESEGLMKLVAHWAPRMPMLGVCLGLQALVEWSGGSLRQMASVRHGMAGIAKRLADGDLLLGELSPCFQVGHYHSWCADRSKLPDDWEVTAEVESEPDIVLAMRHRSLPLNAVQFHPESVLTPDGRRILKAWLSSLQP